MIFRFVTGKLGTGKTLVCIGVALSYLKKGKMVATNVDFYPEHFRNKHNKDVRIFRLPDHPTADDLRQLPPGNPTLIKGPDGSYRPGPSYDPNANSLLLLDELAQFMNSRDFQKKGRTDLISVLVLLRKMGWDAYFIVQHIEMIDKQIREGLAQETGYCRDMSRLPIPVLGTLVRLLTGKALTFPKIHMVTFRDGYTESGIKIERYKFRADDVKNVYNTAQTLSADYVPSWAINHHGTAGTHCLLTPWHLVGYKLPPALTLKQQILKAIGTLLVTLAYGVYLLLPTEARKRWILP